MEQVEFKITKGGVPKLTGATEVANGQEAIKITSDADDSDWTFWAYSTPDAMKKLEQIGVFEVSGVEVHLAYGKPYKDRTVIAYASDYMLGETHDGRFAKRALYIWIPYMWREGYTPRWNPLSGRPEPNYVELKNRENPPGHNKTAAEAVTKFNLEESKRMKRIIEACQTYNSDLNKRGLPRMKFLRMQAGIFDITRKERKKAWESR